MCVYACDALTAVPHTPRVHHRVPNINSQSDSPIITIIIIITDGIITIIIITIIIITDGIITDGIITDGIITDGIITDGIITDGIITDGIITDGIITDGIITDGIITDGMGGTPRSSRQRLDPRPSTLVVLKAVECYARGHERAVTV